MNKLFAVLVVAMAIYTSFCLASVNSGGFRTRRIRLSAGAVQRNRFTLTRTPTSARSGGLGSRGPLRRRLPGRRVQGSRSGQSARRGSVASRLGSVSALRGQGGSIDFSRQQNSILPDRMADKYSQPENFNQNKINIESKIALVPEETSATTEEVHVGQTAIVHCTFDDAGQIGGYKQAKIWWTKLSERGADRPVILAAGTQVRIPDDRLRVVAFPDNTFSILIIKDVLPEDAGRYKCSLPTLTGTMTSFATLKVKEAKNKNVAISPKENSLDSGDELNLFCRPEDESLNVWWTAKDSTGRSIEVTRGFDRVAGKTLTIRNIQRNQAGVYTCHVAVSVGAPIRRHFNVIVKERPWPIEAYIAGFKINSLLASYNRDPVYGDNVNLRCDSGGVPVPSITWYKGGRPLGDSYKYAISAFEPAYKDNAVISKLTIKSFQKYDEGSYECKAVNDAGMQRQEFSVQGVADDAAGSPDDEDYARSALKGRNGAVRISICKAGMPCSTNHRRNGYAIEGSGDDEY